MRVGKMRSRQSEKNPYHASSYIAHLYISSGVLKILVKHASFKSSGVIFWPPLHSWLLDDDHKFSMDKRDRLVCRDSDSSYNTTDLSLILLKWPQSSKASWLSSLCICWPGTMLAHVPRDTVINLVFSVRHMLSPYLHHWGNVLKTTAGW